MVIRGAGGRLGRMSDRHYTIEFRGCAVRVFPDSRYCDTTFPDGTSVPATPTNDDWYRTVARDLGYGEDTWRMCREHEILHTWLAERAGLPHSPTLWDVAHGRPASDAHYNEESAVLALQRDVNDSSKTVGLVLEARRFLRSL